MPADTPMMRQYRTFKEQHPDRILLFRMGDFFEVFFADAERMASLLDLALTRRGGVPMAGVPVHAIDSYLARLLKLGESVVICDQVAAPEKAGQLMERQITRVITPGTLSEEALLPARRDNLVAAACRADSGWGLAWLDIGSGKLIVAEPDGDEELLAELHRRPAAELLLPEDLEPLPAEGRIGEVHPTLRPGWEFDADEGLLRLKQLLKTDSLAAWDCADLSAGLGALGALLCYVAETVRTELPLNQLLRERRQDLLFIDPATRDSLEIDRSLSGDDEATLLAVLDSSSTPMGARLLRQRLQTPIRSRKLLQQRHDAIEELCAHSQLEPLRRAMRPLGDLARSLTRIGLGNAAPRDLLRLRNNLETLPQIAELIADCRAPLLRVPKPAPALKRLGKELRRALVDAPPATIRDGGVLAAGYDQSLDELRELSGSSNRALAQMEQSERNRTGIQQLRAGYNRVHGYFLQVPRSSTAELPPEYVELQTLKNAQRYVTPDLKRHEEAVLSSRSRALEREKWLYRDLLQRAASFRQPLQQIADRLAELDFLACQAERALELNLSRPRFADSPGIRVRNGRHPVVEKLQKSAFTPNDLELNDKRRLLLITGPNMGGKSTYMRQTALLVLMAHAGCFVAADEAVIGPVDRVLTRIGTSDRLGRGQSTFMVEMSEIAYLLRNASEHSLVLLDEVGRGTGTRDGQALSWACLVWFGREHPCQTLFATHFAELTATAEYLPLADNIHFSAERTGKGEGIRFLHRAEPGPTSRSYGLAVALLAGVPGDFYRLAAEQFDKLEAESARSDRAQDQQTLFATEEPAPAEPAVEPGLLESLRLLDPENLTPRQALDYLYQLKKLL